MTVTTEGGEAVFSRCYKATSQLQWSGGAFVTAAQVWLFHPLKFLGESSWHWRQGWQPASCPGTWEWLWDKRLGNSKCMDFLKNPLELSHLLFCLYWACIWIFSGNSHKMSLTSSLSPVKYITHLGKEGIAAWDDVWWNLRFAILSLKLDPYGFEVNWWENKCCSFCWVYYASTWSEACSPGLETLSAGCITSENKQ